MSQLLQISSSVFGRDGVSNQLADRFVAHWQTRNPDGGVTHRDLTQQPLNHLDGALIAALMTPAAERSPEQQQQVALADNLIAEVQQADVLVIGAPMYNFAVPSQLKSWFDHIARAGTTFRYTEQGVEGLLGGKQVYVFASFGGRHSGQASDGVTPWLRTMLGFLGMTELQFIHAEGLNLGDEARSQGIAAAKQQLAALLAA